MTFRLTDMAYLVRSDPARARRKLKAALKKSGGDVTQAAFQFGVTRRTFDRWTALVQAHALPPI
jgi:hypothetical protein